MEDTLKNKTKLQFYYIIQQLLTPPKVSVNIYL